MIRRAIDEAPAERFADFDAMLKAVTGDNLVAVAAATPRSRAWSWRHTTVGTIAAIATAVGVGFIVRKTPLFATAPDSPETKKNRGEHEALMTRLAPLLEENERIGRDYDRKLKELLAFYEKNAPAAIVAMEALTEDPLSPEVFEARLTAAAPAVKALIRPELSMRDDPRVELPRAEWLRRIKAAQLAKKAGEPEPLTTLASAQADAQLLWGDVFEAAGMCPQNPDEQFWFEKRVSSRFYASPLRVTRDLPPMETLWFAKADNDGVMRPLSDGLFRKQLEKARDLIARRKADTTWTPEAAQHATDQLDELMKSALWVEIQIGVFMKRGK